MELVKVGFCCLSPPLHCGSDWACVFQGKLTASAVGQLVGLQSEEIKQFASEYAEKVSSSASGQSLDCSYCVSQREGNLIPS